MYHDYDFTIDMKCILLTYVAAQMWLLARLLPLIVGDWIPKLDDRWENFRLLMKAVDRLFAPDITVDNVAYLNRIISEHHHEFVRLYPGQSVIPKMHYMIHMPRLIYE